MTAYLPQPQPIQYIAPKASLSPQDLLAAEGVLNKINYTTYHDHTLKPALLGTFLCPIKHLAKHEAQREYSPSRALALCHSMLDNDLRYAHPVEAIMGGAVLREFKEWCADQMSVSGADSSLVNLPDLLQFPHHGSLRLRVFAGQHHLKGWKMAMNEWPQGEAKPLHHDCYAVNVYSPGVPLSSSPVVPVSDFISRN